MKRCSKCGLTKALDEFNRDSRRKDGRRADCRTCVAEQGRRYRGTNREAIAKYQRSYYDSHREAVAARHRRYYLANIDRKREQGRLSYLRSRAAKPLYKTWWGILGRCLDPEHPAFHNYGGRGIGVHEAWLEYATFEADVLAEIGPRPPDPAGWTSKVAYWTLDRTNNDRGYEPGNLRWATHSQQNRNQRKRFANQQTGLEIRR